MMAMVKKTKKWTAGGLKKGCEEGATK